MPLNNSIQVPKVLASRAYTNNLPLALEPIRHTLNTHRSSMAIMLLLRKRLCQWVSYIVKCRYFAYFHTTPKYVIGSSVRSRLLSLCDSTIVITIETNGIHNARNYVKSLMNFLIQITSFAALEAAIYSASVVESATVSCFELFKLTAPPFQQNT